MGMTARRAHDVLDLLAGRWVLPVLVALRPEPLRFGDLRGVVGSGISDRSLAMTLRRLEEAGLVLHSDTADHQHGLYGLHADGRSLLNALSDFFRWTETHCPDTDQKALRAH